MRIPARIQIPLIDLLKLYQTGVPWESKVKLIEAYGIDAKFNISARSLIKDRKLRWHILKQLRQVLKNSEIV